MKLSKTKDLAIELTRGTLNPMLAKLTAQPCDPESTLVISGFPRSGTTWLAEIMLHRPRTGLIFEPLNHVELSDARHYGFDWHNFRQPHEHWPEARVYLAKVLSGQTLNRWTTANMTFKQATGVDRWVVKFVRANLMLGWLLENFQLPPPVVLLRHPCAVFSSWVERGWPLTDYPPPKKYRFFAAYPQLLDYVHSLKHPEEFFAASWAMQHYAIFNNLNPDAYYLCFYERLMRDKLSEVERIFEHWQLALPDNLEAAIATPSRKASSGLQADTGKQLAGWQRKLDKVTQDRIIAVAREFGIDFYSEDVDPQR